jgi:hypothetical protein
MQSNLTQARKTLQLSDQQFLEIFSMTASLSKNSFRAIDNKILSYAKTMSMRESFVLVFNYSIHLVHITAMC